jgi:hypothetical protein
MSILFDGVYENPTTPWWGQGISNPANIEASTITINAEPAGNILLTSVLSSTTEFNAPLIFQRPAADPNAPSESLVMNLSDDVPTKPVNGEYISATKASGTAYDDIAVEGLQIYGNQTTSANSGAHAYITGEGGNLVLAPKNSVFISSLQVSSLQVVNVISTTAGVANSYTANLWMSTPVIYAGSVSTNQISTNSINATTANISTINVSTLNAPNFTVSTVSSLIVDTKVTLTSTLSLLGNPTNVNLGLGNVIQGLVGGAATQALGVGIGTAALVTGSVALVTGRTSGGVNSNVFQTVNGSTQLQFSTIGSAVSSIFLTVNSPNPLTTPGLEISTSQGVAAGTYCVRSVGDPLYITNNVSSIQMYGQWVPVIQPTATIPTVAISSLNVSSINGLTPGGGGGGGIPSTISASTITINGNQTQLGTGTFNWGGNTMSPTQVVLARPTSVNNTLTTSAGVFLNAGATVNNSLNVASGGATIFSGLNVASGGATIQSGLSVPSGNVNVSNNLFTSGVLQGGTIQAIGSLSVGGGGVNIAGGGINMAAGNLTMNNGSSVANITNVNVNQTVNANLLRANDISTNSISTNAITTASISATSINTSNINVSSINNAPYPPGGGSGAIPSTINASTINVNGGLTVTNNDVNINNQTALKFNNSAIFGGGFGDFRIRLGTSASKMEFTQSSGNNDSIIMDLKADKTTRFYSTLLVRDSTWPSPQPSGAAIRTYDVTDPAPYGSVLTSNVSAVNMTASGRISTIFISTDTLTANNTYTTFLSTGTATANIIGSLAFSTITASALTCVVGGGSGGNLGLVYTDTNTQYGYTRSIGASITTFLDPSSVGWNIQNGYTYGTNTIMRCYGNNSASPGTAQFFSTLTVCQNPASTPNEACIQTYNATTDPTPRGSVFTKTVSTQSIQVSSINGFSIPQSLGLPTGSIIMWGGTTDVDPPGFYICDGRLLSVSVDPALYAVIGDSYYNNYPQPISPGTFFLPDLTFATPQGAPKTNYFASFTVQGNYRPGAPGGLVNTTYNVPGVSPSESANRLWIIITNKAGTINVGSLIPAGQYPGQSVALYIQSIVQTDPTTGNPSIIAVQSVDNSFVAFLGQGNTVNINCTGVFRQASPLPSYWVPGAFNELAFTNPGSNGPGTTAPYKRNMRTQAGVEVGEHSHSYNRYGVFGSTGLANGTLDPSKSSSFIETAGPTQNIYDFLGNNWAAPYPTKPNVINMFYVIKY